MPILRRDDGIQFALQPYRELLPPSKSSLLKNEIRMLAENHGEYAHIYKQPNGFTEGVFSRDPGFLLGEAIWQHFGKPTDLIYCEELKERNTVLLIVVRDGSVYLDTKVPASSLPDELASLVADRHHYQIFIYGDVPLSQTPEPNKFSFDPSQIKLFQVLNESVFQRVKVDDSLQLEPLEFVLRGLRFGIPPSLWIAIASIVLIILLAWWFQGHRAKPKSAVITPTVTQAPSAPVDPYLNYRNSLMSPSPAKQIAELATVAGLVSTIPGWQPTGVTFNGSTYTIRLNSMGGSVQWLNRWANARNIGMTLNSQGVVLTLGSKISGRSKPDAIYPAKQVVELIIDRLDSIMPTHSVGLGATTNQGSYKTTLISIQFTEISPSVLNLIGRQLYTLPVKLLSAQVTFAQGLWSGVIQLTVLGN